MAGKSQARLLLWLHPFPTEVLRAKPCTVQFDVLHASSMALHSAHPLHTYSTYNGSFQADSFAHKHHVSSQRRCLQRAWPSGRCISTWTSEHVGFTHPNATSFFAALGGWGIYGVLEQLEVTQAILGRNCLRALEDRNSALRPLCA